MTIVNRYQPLEPPRPGAPLRARDLQTAQTVLLREVGTLPPGQLEAAFRHIQAAKRIFHPSLITLFDAAALPGDRVLLAYEFVPAQSVRQLSGGQPFNARRAAEVVGEIADAVAELHARGVVHGAISSDTVLITMKGKAKLDRIADPSLDRTSGADEESDLKAMVSLLRDLTHGAQAIPAVLEAILEHDDGAAFGSAATLAASLRAAAR